MIGSDLIILLGPHKVTVIEKYRSTVWLHWTGFSVCDFYVLEEASDWEEASLIAVVKWQVPKSVATIFLYP